MKPATQIFRTFPFSSFDYQIVDASSGNNVVSFDVLKCPVAEFFKNKGKGDTSPMQLGANLTFRWQRDGATNWNAAQQ